MPTTVTIGADQITLAPPASYAVRSEIVLAGASEPAPSIRVLAAALAACWQGPHRPKADYLRAKCNPHVFGGSVLDELAERGIKLDTVLRAGTMAYDMLGESVSGTWISEEEVKAAEGFTGSAVENVPG